MGNNSFLFLICIKNQSIRVEAPGIGVSGVHCGMAFVDESLSIVVSTQCIENRVVKEFGCARHLKRDVREVRYGKSWRDRDIVEVRDEPPQPVESAIRAERAVVIGQCDECSVIESNAELFVKFAHECWIESE